MTNSSLIAEYKEQYKIMHDKGNFSGGSLKYSYAPSIKSLVEKTNSKTVLDFGCGKAKSYKSDNPINNHFGIKLEDMDFYDIGVEEYQILPEKIFDGLICTDVLEHVPEELLDSTLETIFSKCSKFAFLVIHCGLAAKILPNGQNAHITVKPPSWWNSKLSKYYTVSRLVHVQYQIPKDPKHNILGL